MHSVVFHEVVVQEEVQRQATTKAGSISTGDYRVNTSNVTNRRLAWEQKFLEAVAEWRHHAEI